MYCTALHSREYRTTTPYCQTHCNVSPINRTAKDNSNSSSPTYTYGRESYSSRARSPWKKKWLLTLFSYPQTNNRHPTSTGGKEGETKDRVVQYCTVQYKDEKEGGKALVEQDQNAANLAVCLSVCVPFFELSGVME